MARDPDEVLSELLFGFLGTQLLYVVSTLGIADLIDSEPEAIDVLAPRADASPDVLDRLLRALAALGVFAEVEDRASAQTPTSALLRRDSGSGWHEFTIVYGSVYRAFAEALPAVKTGENMFERGSGSGCGNGSRRDLSLDRRSIARCRPGAHARIAALSDFPWQDVETVIDVGGGNGTLVIGLLEQRPQLHGVVYDLPEVAEAASVRVAEASLSDRCVIEKGSFFRPGAARRRRLSTRTGFTTGTTTTR